MCVPSVYPCICVLLFARCHTCVFGEYTKVWSERLHFIFVFHSLCSCLPSVQVCAYACALLFAPHIHIVLRAHTCTVSMCSDCTHVSSVRGLYICWLRACAHGHDVRAYVQKVCSKLRLCLVLAQASSEHMCMCLRIAATIEIFRVFHKIVRLQIVFESKVIRKAFFNPQNPEHDAHFH